MSMNTHQVLFILIVDTRILGCVADPLQERRFASISLTDHKDTKAFIFRSELIDFIESTPVVGKEVWEHRSRTVRFNIDKDIACFRT